MAHAEKCPICYGKGKITEHTNCTAGSYERTCHGCGGSGWVTVRD